MNPDRIVIGAADVRASEVVRRIYERFQCPVLVTSLNNAEMIKYAANGLLALLISYSNEIASFCEAIPNTDDIVVIWRSANGSKADIAGANLLFSF